MNRLHLASLFAAALAAPCPAQLFGFGQAEGRATTPARLEEPAGCSALRVGFNQAWFGTRYGHQWGSSYDPVEAQRVLEDTRSLGGSVLRMWLLEGIDPDGVEWTRPGRDAQRGRPVGYSAQHLENLEDFLGRAEATGVQVYLTFFTGNFYEDTSREDYAARKAEWWNMFHDLHGVDEAWRSQVLEPVLEVMARHPRALFAVDLMNEGNALVARPSDPWFEDGWETYTAWVRRWRAAIRARVDVPVGVSFGHHLAVGHFLQRRLPEDAVDFFDIHVYDDAGRVPRERAVARRIGELSVPVYMGEFGQDSEAFDDGVQARAARGFLESAERLGFAAALAWRLEDVRPGHNTQARHSYWAFGQWREAAGVLRGHRGCPGVD